MARPTNTKTSPAANGKREFQGDKPPPNHNNRLAPQPADRPPHRRKTGPLSSRNRHLESGDIEYSADIAMILAEDKTEAADPDGVYQPPVLKIIKNRNGERGVVKLRFDPRTAKFVETGRGELSDVGGDEGWQSNQPGA